MSDKILTLTRDDLAKLQSVGELKITIAVEKAVAKAPIDALGSLLDPRDLSYKGRQFREVETPEGEPRRFVEMHSLATPGLPPEHRARLGDTPSATPAGPDVKTFVPESAIHKPQVAKVPTRLSDGKPVLSPKAQEARKADKLPPVTAGDILRKQVSEIANEFRVGDRMMTRAELLAHEKARRPDKPPPYLDPEFDPAKTPMAPSDSVTMTPIDKALYDKVVGDLEQKQCTFPDCPCINAPPCPHLPVPM